MTLLVGDAPFTLIGCTPADNELVRELLPNPLTTRSIVARLVEACRDHQVRLVIRTDLPPTP